MPYRPTVIKKYSDRRLYDSAARRYVNLDDIARLIREGADVKVVDGRTGKDLTRVILTQIIMDDTRGGENGLPVKLLRQLVVASDRVSHDFLSWYLDTVFELYKKTGTAVLSGVSEARSAVTNPMEFVRRLLGAEAHPTGTANAEVEDLRRQVEELQAQLARPRPRRKPSTKVRRRGDAG